MHYALGDYVLDIVQNSIEAGAKTIRVSLDETDEALSAAVADDGCGMSEETRARALDPFRSGGAKHPGRKVGLGLPFLVQAVEQSGGSWALESEEGKGTTVRFSFPAGHPDAPPVGDVPGLFLSLMAFEGDYELAASRSYARGGKRFSWEARRSELTEAAGDPRDAGALALMREFLASQEGAGR